MIDKNVYVLTKLNEELNVLNSKYAIYSRGNGKSMLMLNNILTIIAYNETIKLIESSYDIYTLEFAHRLIEDKVLEYMSYLRKE